MLKYLGMKYWQTTLKWYSQKECLGYVCLWLDRKQSCCILTISEFRWGLDEFTHFHSFAVD